MVDLIVRHIQNELRMACANVTLQQYREVVEQIQAHCLVLLHAISDQQANDDPTP